MKSLEGAPRPHLPLALELLEQLSVGMLGAPHALAEPLPAHLGRIPQSPLPSEEGLAHVAAQAVLPEAEAAGVHLDVRVVPINNPLTRVDAPRNAGQPTDFQALEHHVSPAP
eukprot:CAMPEP_0169455230 /NCGR_PEP_ID=MMETSP1042-20121227/15707_1 /TAXON_ID=464988 /ORGANISM="Hemiselmis andersenii, Strain CCMP1180" /LENGTH=111 /DNA_ID=CAMNT_0009567369 /DNA_START=38 /DNA_END=370 /DNA_ORIENTATION=-